MSDPIVPTDLPLLTDIIDADGSTLAIPTLTEEVVPHTEETTPALDLLAPIDFYPASSASSLGPTAETVNEVDTSSPPTGRVLDPAEMQLIIDHFTHHLETVFTEKLDRHLRQLHHQAVHLAITELKAELPELLRNLQAPDEPQR